MPFLVHRNRDGTFRISNAETGKVYAYATTKPTQVMSIVERYHNAAFPQRRKSGRRGSAARGDKRDTFCAPKDIDCQLNNLFRKRGSGRRGGKPGFFQCQPGDIECELDRNELYLRYGRFD